MALPSTVYKLTLELSDVDRGVYETLPLRLAQHPSEAPDRVVARALAYALLYEEGLEFGKGLSDADEPTLATHDLTGRLVHWVDVGLPSADRLHVASKKTDRVTVVCHKEPRLLHEELARRKVHRAEHLELWFLEPAFVSELGKRLERSSSWTVVHHDGELSVTAGELHLTTTLVRQKAAD